METQADIPQITIRLQILPEKQNSQNKALANTIGHEIFNGLTKDKDQGDYRIEPVYTEEMGGDITFLILLSPLVTIAGQALIDAMANEVAGTIVEKTLDTLKQVMLKIKNIKHKTTPVTVEMKLPTDEITVQGSLATALNDLDDTIIPALEDIKKQLAQQLAQNKDNQKVIEITITTITIKVPNS